jgi:hypothetical protein
LAKSVNISEAHLLPLAAPVKPKAGVDEHHNAVACGNELLRLAAAFRPVGARLGQITGHLLASVIGTAAGELRRFGPFDLRIEL